MFGLVVCDCDSPDSAVVAELRLRSIGGVDIGGGRLYEY